ncbi:MAG: 23S rRNA (uracil1939-C5)-methyltransferase [Francisellaceae bacterium]
MRNKLSRRSRKKQIPEGVYKATVEKLTHEGRGIAKIEGKTVFLAFGLPGEEVEFKYTHTKSKFDEGQVTSVINASTDRVDPICEAYERCGGCSFQHVSPDFQIKHKQDVLSEQFQHFGGIQPESWLQPLRSPKTEGYRKKARLGVRYVIKKEKVLVGFRERNGRYLAEIDNCPVLHPSIGDKLLELQQLILGLDCLMTLPQIEVAVDDQKTALIIRHLEPLSENDLTKIIQFGKDNDYWIYLQPKGPTTVHLIYPDIPEKEQYLKYKLSDYGLEIQFRPGDFTQVNSGLNELMLKQAIELLDVQDTDNILDLFCGLGNFSLPLAKKAFGVVGIEGDDPMVKQAYVNAENNNINNAEFYVADLFKPCAEFDWAKKSFDKILLDPPRAGAEEIVRQVEIFNAKKIVYISCNPATLARDAGILVKEKGYRMTQAGVMDMFPHTTHVESIAVFER